MNSEQFIQVLRKRRRELEITQQHLSAGLGVTDSYISLVESGKRDIKLKHFVEACKILGLDVMVKEKGNDQT